jgi:hypothetical protein
MKKYPDPYVLKIIKTMRRKYTRAARILVFLYDITNDFLIRIFNTDQNRWNKYRKVIKFIDSYTEMYQITYDDVTRWSIPQTSAFKALLEQFKANNHPQSEIDQMKILAREHSNTPPTDFK